MLVNAFASHPGWQTCEDLQWNSQDRVLQPPNILLMRLGSFQHYWQGKPSVLVAIKEAYPDAQATPDFSIKSNHTTWQVPRLPCVWLTQNYKGTIEGNKDTQDQFVCLLGKTRNFNRHNFQGFRSPFHVLTSAKSETRYDILNRTHSYYHCVNPAETVCLRYWLCLSLELWPRCSLSFWHACPRNERFIE